MADHAKFDARGVWQEIQSFIKGRSSRGDCMEYSAFHKQTIGFVGDEDAVLAIAQNYSKWCRNHNLWDRQDAAYHILQRLYDIERFLRVDELLVDEVQDLSAVELTILLRICTLSGLSVAGDAAQIVSDVTFRFCDLRTMLNEEMSRCPFKRTRSDIQIEELTVNHRSTEGIVMLSNTFLELLGRFFPTTIDKTPPAIAGHRGLSLPALMTCEDFADTFLGDGTQKILNSDQIVLTPRFAEFPATISERYPNFQDRNLCLCSTPAAVKGQEFDDVFIIGWFTHSAHSALWHELMASFHKDKKQLPKIWMDRHHAPLHIELKHLIVAITRARSNVIFVEPKHHVVTEWLISEGKLTRGLSEESREDILRRAIEGQGVWHWLRRARAFFAAQSYHLSLSSYRRCGILQDPADIRQFELCVAYVGVESDDANRIREAGRIFERYGEWRSAAECFASVQEYEQASYAFEHLEQWILAAENARSCRHYKRAGILFDRGEDYRNSIFRVN